MKASARYVHRLAATGVLLSAVVVASISSAQSPAKPPRSEVVLHATHPDGVPLHACRKCRGVSGRLADETRVRVLEVGAERHWWHVRAPSGIEGWIVETYLAAARASTSLSERSPWASRRACEKAVKSGSRLERDGREVRMGSWNLHWFPEGRSQHGSGSPGTDIRWMACVIVWMDVDVLAVQEVLQNLRGRRGWLDLLHALERLSGTRWKGELDHCPDDGRLHVGWLWRIDRARATEPRMLDMLNPHGRPCAHHLRPGLAMRLHFDRGPEVSAVSVHLDSGKKPRDFHNRRKSWRQLSGALDALDASSRNPLLVLGDLNTMGCSDCGLGASEELALLDARLAELTPPLQRLNPSGSACTHHYGGRGALLDHVLTNAGFQAQDARIVGVCADAGCRVEEGSFAALSHLSDHCPVVVDSLLPVSSRPDGAPPQRAGSAKHD